MDIDLKQMQKEILGWDNRELIRNLKQVPEPFVRKNAENYSLAEIATGFPKSIEKELIGLYDDGLIVFLKRKDRPSEIFPIRTIDLYLHINGADLIGGAMP